MPGNTTGGAQLTFEAAADLSSAQYGVVALNTSEQVGLMTGAASAAQVPTGVLYNKPIAGANALVRMFTGGGKITVQAGAAVTAGDRLTVTTSGQVITVAAVGTYMVGQAVTAAGAAGERLDMIAMSPTVVSSA